jgi:hypothetical protein
MQLWSRATLPTGPVILTGGVEMNLPVPARIHPAHDSYGYDLDMVVRNSKYVYGYSYAIDRPMINGAAQKALRGMRLFHLPLVSHSNKCIGLGNRIAN